MEPKPSREHFLLGAGNEATIGGDTAENERTFATILTKNLPWIQRDGLERGAATDGPPVASIPRHGPAAGCRHAGALPREFAGRAERLHAGEPAAAGPLGQRARREISERI